MANRSRGHVLNNFSTAQRGKKIFRSNRATVRRPLSIESEAARYCALAHQSSRSLSLQPSVMLCFYQKRVKDARLCVLLSKLVVSLKGWKREREREKTKAIGEGKEVEMTMSQADDDGISFGRGHNIRVKKKERQIKKKKKRVGCVTRKPTVMRIEYNNLIREKRERERKKRGSKCFLSFVCFMAVRALFSPSYSRSPLW